MDIAFWIIKGNLFSRTAVCLHKLQIVAYYKNMSLNILIDNNLIGLESQDHHKIK